MSTVSRNVFTSYALDVVDGVQVACEYVQLACARYLAFFDKYDFDERKVLQVINFIRGFRHFQGRYSGKSFELLPYQIWIVSSIFGFYHRGTRDRVVHYVYIELARKQGKTALMAAICLYMMIADGENGSEVELLANSKKQATICFDLARNFSRSKDPREKWLRTFRDKILFDHTRSYLQVLASEAAGNDGWNSYCFCLDECHAQKDSRLWDVMTSSQGARGNYIASIITTAGLSIYGFCYQYRRGCLDVLYNATENDSQFVAIYTLDEGDDWEDESCWVKSNPSLGYTVTSEYLRQQIANAKIFGTEVSTKTKNFNLWMQSSEVWLSDKLLLNLTQKVDLNDYRGQFCFVGVDLSATRDLTAVAVSIPVDDTYVFKVFYYLPASELEGNENSELYKKWHRLGLLTVTPGNVVDYDYITTDILKVGNVLSISKIAYDKWNAVQWAIKCTELGMPLEPFSQALWSFNQPSKEFERLALSGKVVIDNNEITRWCFSNVTLKFDHNENMKPVKTHKMLKIDGVIAIIESLGVQLLEPSYDNEVYAL